MIWGHDDTSKLQAAYDTAAAGARALYIPQGNYLHHGLNFTGGHGRAAQHLIYGDGYGSTNLWAIAVTDPGSTEAYSSSIGVDISVTSETAIRDVAFFGGGMNTRGVPFADLAPAVNVFCARQAQTGGNPLSILHTWDNVYTETLGAYDVVWDGCEQTNLVDSHFQTDSDKPMAAFYLTNVNTPRFASPWVRIIAPGAASGNTMTKLAFSGARTSFVGKGNMVVLDEGTTNGIFQISLSDGYAHMGSPANGGPCNFISDTAPTHDSYVRTVKLDQFYIEGEGQECAAVKLTAQAIQWTIIGTQRYPAQNKVPHFQFTGGFLSSYAQVDGQYVYASTTPVLSASSCKGSILQLGPMNQNPPGCNDYAILTNTQQFMPGIPSNGTSLRPYAFPSFSAITWAKLGTWVGSHIGDTVHISVDSTGGEQSRAGQQGFIDIAAAIGNTVAAPNITGITGWSYGAHPALVTPSGLLIAATGGSLSATNLSWDIWVQEQPYSYGTYRVVISDGATWKPSGAAGIPPTGAYVVNGNIVTVKGN